MPLDLTKQTRAGTQHAIRNHIRGLQALGYAVTLTPAA
jgi:hypothetical protein